MKKRFAVVLALVAQANLANAQDSGQDAPVIEAFEVIGVAVNDLLNLRATASPAGMLVARIPNGTLVRNHGCAEVNGSSWCKVAEVDNPTVMGWAAERYLQATSIELPAE